MGKRKKKQEQTPDEIAQQMEAKDDLAAIPIDTDARMRALSAVDEHGQDTKIQTDAQGYVITSDQAQTIQALETEVRRLTAKLAEVGASTSEGPLACGVCKREMRQGEKAHMTPESKVVRCQSCMLCGGCGRPLVDKANELRSDAIPLGNNDIGHPLCRDCVARTSTLP